MPGPSKLMRRGVPVQLPSFADIKLDWAKKNEAYQDVRLAVGLTVLFSILICGIIF